MDMLTVKGGAKLSGEIFISGSKNASLPIMIATILSQKPSTLTNIPKLADTEFLVELLESFGAECDFSSEKKQLLVNAEFLKKSLAHYDVVRKMRASILVLAPLLARFGHAQVSLPGGCAIGSRPVDIHLNGLAEMGAKIEVKDGYIFAKLSNSSFKGRELSLALPSVGATEQLIMAAVLAEGATVIKQAAKEPEVVELCNALNQAGAKISGIGTSIINIQGVTSLNGLKYTVGPDRIEIGTFLSLAAATKSSFTLKRVNIREVANLMEAFSRAGCLFKTISEEDGLADLMVIGPNKLQATHIETAIYPGFPTDMQAQFMAAMCLAEGTSTIYERIFENRMMHVPELRRMGANISVKNGVATVVGQARLLGAPVMATDLRASASLVIAALAAEGQSEIRRLYHLDRGYESLDKKLLSLGANIIRSKQTDTGSVV